MDINEFLVAIDKKLPPAPELELSRLEFAVGQRLPEDYREFLVACNGGYVGGALWFRGPTPLGQGADAGVHHIGGFCKQTHFSLSWKRECYEGRIPKDLMWIMDDPFGNAICLGVSGNSRGKVSSGITRWSRTRSGMVPWKLPETFRF
jgi:hypothetical protein